MYCIVVTINFYIFGLYCLIVVVWDTERIIIVKKLDKHILIKNIGNAYLLHIQANAGDDILILILATT